MRGARQDERVVVKYPSFSRGNMDPTGTDGCAWRYVLGTGRTWKGPIQALYLLLPPAIYRLYIRDVYPGTRWKDTCLGEIVFHSTAAR